MSDQPEIILKPKFKPGDIIERGSDPRFGTSSLIGTIKRCFWSAEQKQFIYLFESFTNNKEYGNIYWSGEEYFKILTEVKGGNDEKV
jgi:hypothetical protein